MFWSCGMHRIDLSQGPLVMGILNATPDSFSDGYSNFGAACRQAEILIADGADIIDVGGESTRPGSKGISLDQELVRVLPLIDYLSARHRVLISIDTQKPEVARQAVAAGAHIINHVSASLDYGDMIPILAQSNAAYVAMHMKDRPEVMQKRAGYANVCAEVTQVLAQIGADLKANGINSERLLFDPGIGFGKKLEHNLALLKGCQEIATGTGRPLLMGLSRKSWFTHLFQDELADLNERDLYTVVASMTLDPGPIAVHRVHNVKWLKRALELQQKLREK